MKKMRLHIIVFHLIMFFPIVPEKLLTVFCVRIVPINKQVDKAQQKLSAS